MPNRPSPDLETLARLYGVQTSYWDILGKQREAGAEALVGVLAALGARLESEEEVAEALAARREELATRLAEPVAVAWDGERPRIALRVPVGVRSLSCHLDIEGGERRGSVVEVAGLPPGSEPGTVDMALGPGLPTGYHRLAVEAGKRRAEVLVISAPRRTFQLEGPPLWGVFLPLYALRTERSWGAGDLSDLERLAEWTAGLGGGVVATLPLLAAFLDAPFEPSPYAPASRQFWNELYLDPRRVPGYETSGAARRLVESPEFRREADALSVAPLVDYERLAILKRRALEELAQRFFGRSSERQEEFERFVRAKPLVEAYAAFRAVGDRRGEPWQSWPERLRDGSLAPADYDEEDRRYHLWVQWTADEQMSALAGEARRRGPGLYLDLPLGAHASSFDVWRERDLFAEGASAGAPPDPFFSKGQDWGFPPLRPERLRERGYDHFIDCLRHHLAHAGLLRLDHVMQLHRLFWVPRGLPAADGVYVQYPAEELYAVLSVESHRHRAALVGENLGTVPPEVDEAMGRHGVLGMYVVQYELQPGGAGLLREPPAASVASLNTHDMPPFRAFWEGRDIDELEALGFFDAGQARAERERRAALRARMLSELRPPAAPEEAAAAYPRVLEDRLLHLGASPARMVLVNLEDLWGETEPQNGPGTHTERANWRRKARLAFEDFAKRPEVADRLRKLDEVRRGRA